MRVQREKNKNGGGRLRAFHYLKLSRRTACVENTPPTIDVIGTMEHLEERPAPICPLLFC